MATVKQTVSSAGKDVEKRELPCTAGKDVKVQRRGKQFFKSLNRRYRRVGRTVEMSRRELGPVRRPLAAAPTYQDTYVVRKRGKMSKREGKHPTYQNVHPASQDRTIIICPFLMSFSNKLQEIGSHLYSRKQP